MRSCILGHATKASLRTKPLVQTKTRQNIAWRKVSPEDVIDHWLVCMQTLEVLHILDEVGSLCTTHWRQQYAGGGWSVAKGGVPHALPQLNIPAARKFADET